MFWKIFTGQFAKNSKNGIVEMINKPSILNSGPQFQGNMTNFLQNVPLFRSLGPDGVAQVSKVQSGPSFFMCIQTVRVSFLPPKWMFDVADLKKILLCRERKLEKL